MNNVNCCRDMTEKRSNAIRYYVKRKKCKVNDVIFPSGCEACAINTGNRNMKICIFSIRLKNIFTAQFY